MSKEGDNLITEITSMDDVGDVIEDSVSELQNVTEALDDNDIAEAVAKLQVVREQLQACQDYLERNQ